MVKRAQNLHNNIANDIAPPKSLLICTQCHKRVTITRANVANYLRSGWPECCGLTMTWELNKKK